jgi:hypothetical protein
MACARNAAAPNKKAADLILCVGLSQARTLAHSMRSDAKRGEEWTRAKGLDYVQAIALMAQSVLRRGAVTQANGWFYQVAIASDPALLDWDKPLMAQSARIQEALRAAPCLGPRMNGASAYATMARHGGAPQQRQPN